MSPSPAGRRRWIWLTLAVLLVADLIVRGGAWLRPDQQIRGGSVIPHAVEGKGHLAAIRVWSHAQQAPIAYPQGAPGDWLLGVNVGDRVKEAN